MNVREALAVQAIGSIDRQIENALAFGQAKGKQLALSPMTIRNAADEQRFYRTITISHDYAYLDQGEQPPAGWVIVEPDPPPPLTADSPPA